MPTVPTATPSRCLLLFTKPAVPGRVKTRLTGDGPGSLDADRAARLHAAFLGDLAERLLPATTGGEMRLRLAWAAADAGAPLPDLGQVVAPVGELRVPPGAAVDAVRQRGDDLGERLYTALADAAVDHPGGVAAVGSDHPDLPLSRVRRAFEMLGEGADVVLGPADDGGYYLIALTPAAVREEIFRGVAWSTATVRTDTEERCREAGLDVRYLPPGHDVDEPADLDRLAARLVVAGEDGNGADCPRTRGLLAAWGRLPVPVRGGRLG